MRKLHLAVLALAMSAPIAGGVSSQEQAAYFDAAGIEGAFADKRIFGEGWYECLHADGKLTGKWPTTRNVRGSWRAEEDDTGGYFHFVYDNPLGHESRYRVKVSGNVVTFFKLNGVHHDEATIGEFDANC